MPHRDGSRLIVSTLMLWLWSSAVLCDPDPRAAAVPAALARPDQVTAGNLRVVSQFDSWSRISGGGYRWRGGVVPVTTPARNADLRLLPGALAAVTTTTAPLLADGFE